MAELRRWKAVNGLTRDEQLRHRIAQDLIRGYNVDLADDERKPYDPDYINGLVDHLFETQRDMSVDYHEHLRLALDKLRL